MIDVIEAINIDVLLIMSGIILLVTFLIQGLVAWRRSLLAALTIDQPEPETGIFPSGAIPLRMDPELNWARYDDRPYGLVVMTMRGRSLDQALQALGSSLRGEEQAYRISDTSVAVGLWNCNEQGMLGAIERLAAPMEAAGDVVIEAGGAIFPYDAATSLELIKVAQSRRMPVDQLRDMWRDGAFHPSRSASARSISLLIRTLPGLLGALVASIVCWVGIGRFVHGSITDPLIRYGASFGIAIVIASVIMLTWNYGVAREPRSAGMSSRASVIGIVTVLVAMFSLLAWSIAVPSVPVQISGHAGVLCVAAAALLIPVWHGRYLARADQPLVPLMLAVAGGALTLATYQQLPDIANIGRVLAAIGLGAVVARLVDQLAWLVLICAGVTAVDVWSVVSPSGVTSQLFSDDPHRVVNKLLITLPNVDGSPIAMLGSVDLLFLAVFISMAHVWRLSVTRTVLFLWIGLCVPLIMPELTEIGTPVLPFIAGMFLLSQLRPILRSIGFAGIDRSDAGSSGVSEP